MPRKLQPNFIPNESPKDTKILKDLAVEKFKSEIKLRQTRTERYKKRISKLDCEMMEYLQTHFDEDIVAEPSWQWKKECESHENNVKSNFEKKEEWHIENSTEEFRRDTSEETLKTIDTTNQTSINVNFVRQHRSERYDNDRSITEQQPISNQAEETFSNKTQKIIIPIINQRKTKWI